MIYTATYSPEDNKIRLSASSRLPAEVYERVKVAGFRWAPKQDIFVAPMWTPQRADLAEELAGEIGDEDTSLAERAEQRAERFDEYHDKRTADATSAAAGVKRLADGIPLGQPILVGHHSERHARKDAERIENGMRRAVKMWETAEYWTRRAAGAISHAKYKERPDVRARRIKGIEADLRKVERSDKESAGGLRMLELIDLPEKWKANEAGAMPTREERAAYIAGRMNANVSRKNETGSWWSIYDVLRLPVEERYKAAPVMTIDEVLADVRASFARATAYRLRWAEHYRNRLAYERAMLADAGGTVAQRTGPEVGGGCQCWATKAGAWSYIQKVNQVSVTLLDNWGNASDADGSRNFKRTIPFDKLRRILPAAEVAQARAEGRIKDTPCKTGFYLLESRPDFDKREAEAGTPNTPEAEPAPELDRATVDAMRETLRAGITVQAVPQLFPTPRELAERVAELADVQPGHRVLEPSAGTGMLLGALGGRMFAEGADLPPYKERDQVHAVEINAALAARLRTEFPLTDVRCADFLQCNGDMGAFDRIVMNPPFENGSDIKHILHARGMLKPGGRLVAICANGPRQREKLQPLADLWEDLPAGTFKDQGTGVNTALLVIERGRS